MVNLSSVMSVGYRKVLGEHSLTMGEIVGLVVAFLVWRFHILGKYAKFLAVVIGIVAMALF